MKFCSLYFKGSFLFLLVTALISCGDENGTCIRGQGSVETRELQLASIEGLAVNGSTKVYVQEGTVQRVEVKGEPNILDELNTDVGSDGIWQIKTERCLRRHKAIEIFLTVPTIRYTEVNGSGSIELQNNFDSEEFQARVTGSGYIRAAITANRVATRISGSGDAELSGTAEAHDIDISGSGKVKGFNLITERTNADISGSGTAEVTVNQALEANISGSGRVIYQGNPTVNSHVSGSGRVQKR